MVTKCVTTTKRGRRRRCPLLLRLLFVTLDVPQWAYRRCNSSETAPFFSQIAVARSIFNSKGSNLGTLGRIFKTVAMRSEIILNLVLKFQVDIIIIIIIIYRFLERHKSLGYRGAGGVSIRRTAGIGKS